jgi:hypothetical protein
LTPRRIIGSTCQARRRGTSDGMKQASLEADMSSPARRRWQPHCCLHEGAVSLWYRSLRAILRCYALDPNSFVMSCNGRLVRLSSAVTFELVCKKTADQARDHGLSQIHRRKQTQVAAQHNEYNIWTYPVVLGRGKRLFENGARPCALRLVASKVSTTGVVMSTYLPAGDIPIGSLSQTEPSAKELTRRAKMATDAT